MVPKHTKSQFRLVVANYKYKLEHAILFPLYSGSKPGTFRPGYGEHFDYRDAALPKAEWGGSRTCCSRRQVQIQPGKK